MKTAYDIAFLTDTLASLEKRLNAATDRLAVFTEHNMSKKAAEAEFQIRYINKEIAAVKAELV